MGWFSRKTAVPEPAPEPEVELAPEPEPEPEPEPPAPTWPEGIYRGRLVCDGTGHLLADEGEWAAYPVFHNLATDRYVFVAEGGPSHNQIHHVRTAVIAPTRDATENQIPEDVDPHHIRPSEDDPHYAADGGTFHPRRGWSFTRPILDPDEVAATVTGHTDAYVNHEEAA